MGKLEVFDILQMPEKAVDTLLEHLNIWNLMDLRLVCRETKAWVEHPKVLQRLCIPVRERKFLKKLVKSDTNWSNLQISCDTCVLSGSWIRCDEYLRTFSKLGASLKVLRFTEQRLLFSDGLEEILRSCPELKELHIGTLNVKRANMRTLEELEGSLSCLEKLCISYVAWENEEDLKVLSKLIVLCPKLKFLQIPYILSARMYSLFPALKEYEVNIKLESLTNDVLFDPVRKLLNQGEGKVTLKYLDVGNFEFQQLLRGLAPACRESGCLLLNVFEDSESELAPEDGEEICDVIGSLQNCTKYLDLGRLKNLTSIKIVDECVSTSDIDKKYEKAPLPKLKNISLTLTKSILLSERIASCFLQQKREGVESVSVKFDELVGNAQASVFRSIKFASSLPYLRCLELDGFDGKPEDYLLFWDSFPLLETLKLQNCGTLNDHAFIGEDTKKPVVCSLRFLRRLTLEGGEISDLTMQAAVSQMSLEVLVLCLPKVTFAGISHLKSGPLEKSLAVFHSMKPDDCSEDDLEAFFKSFGTLKKHEILF